MTTKIISRALLLSLMLAGCGGGGSGSSGRRDARGAGRRGSYSGATRRQEKEQEGSATIRAHHVYRNTNVAISRAILVVKAHADNVLIAEPPGSLIRTDTSRIANG